MPVVVLGSDDSKHTAGCPQNGRRAPSQVARMAPPHVELAKRQPGHYARPGYSPQECSRRQIGERSEKSVEQDRRIAREHRVFPVGAAPVVVRTQVELEPHVLGDVIKERRAEISGRQDRERCQ